MNQYPHYFDESQPYTLQDVLESLRVNVLQILQDVDEASHGRAPLYLELLEQAIPVADDPAFLKKGFQAMLDQMDDGISKSNRRQKPYPGPLVQDLGCQKVAQCLVEHLQTVLDSSSQLDLSAFGFFERIAIRLFLGGKLEGIKQATEGNLRDYEACEAASTSFPECEEALQEHHVLRFSSTFYHPFEVSLSPPSRFRP